MNYINIYVYWASSISILLNVEGSLGRLVRAAPVSRAESETPNTVVTSSIKS